MTATRVYVNDHHASQHRADVTLEFQDAVFGCQKEVDISHLEECTTCEGSGAKAGATPRTCSQCGGQGQVGCTFCTF